MVRGGRYRVNVYNKMIWEQYQIQWAGVHDNRECPDCWAEEGRGPRLFSELTRTPGDGSTQCGFSCRCVLIFRDILKLMPGFEEGYTESMIKSLEKVSGNLYLEKMEVAQYLEIDRLVYEYERLTAELYGAAGNWNLPETYYSYIQGPEARIKFLKSLIKQIKTNTLSEENRAAIMARMSYHWAGKWPERVK